MLDKFKKLITEIVEESQERPIILGVSGGPDSLTLLYLMDELDYKLIVCHLDHGLRPGSETDLVTVENLTNKMNIPFVGKKEDIKSLTGELKMSIEEVSREIRYEFLFKHAKANNAQAVMVAHNADDQVETILMHLLRGAGSDGLKGMALKTLPNPWSDTIPLIRPLLTVSRDEINQYIQEKGIKPIIDPTNLDTTYFRNRLRHELIPYLETYNPQIKTLITRLGNVVRGESDYLDLEINNIWKNIITYEGNNSISFNQTSFNTLPIAIRRRVVRKAVNKLRPKLRDLNYDLVNEAISFTDTPSKSGYRDFLAGLILSVEGGNFWIADSELGLPDFDWLKIEKDEIYLLNPPDHLELSRGWKCSLLVIPQLPGMYEHIQENNDPFTAWFDADQLEGKLILRTRNPGDRFSPLGMGSKSVKISDLMINQKIPQRVRGQLPLLLHKDQVIWVPGIRASSQFLVQPDTTNILIINISRV